MAETIFTTGPEERIFPNKPGDDIADDQPEQFTPYNIPRVPQVRRRVYPEDKN